MPRGEPYPLTDGGDRALGVWCFNRVWELLEKPDRTASEDAEMLNTAYASRYHWGRMGTEVNFARGDWQIARVCCALGLGEQALRHAQLCLETTEAAGIGDFDLAFAYEGMARALATCGRLEEARQYEARGHEAAANVKEDEDRDLVLADLATCLSGRAARTPASEP